MEPETTEGRHLVPAANPMEMLNTAIEKGMSLDVLSKLMDLQERWEKSQGRKAFDAAVSAAKGEIPPLVRNAIGHNNKAYTDLGKMVEVVDPILSRHGLGYRFRAHQDDRVEVTCVLFHRDGHYEETTLKGPPDKTGNKNDIQAIGSTLTYLQRGSLRLALGLASAADDDGRAAAGTGETITNQQITEIEKLLAETKSSLPAFLKVAKVETLADIRADRFEAAKKYITDTAAKRDAMAAAQAAAKANP